MATINTAATYSPLVPQGSLVSFNAPFCDDYCLVLSNSKYCLTDVILNHRFLDQWENDWTIVTGTSEGVSPALIKDESGAPGAPTIRQNITLLDGNYTFFYSFENTTQNGTWSGDVTLNLNTYSLFNVGNNALERGRTNVNLSGITAEDLDIVFATNDDSDIIKLNYFYICPTDNFIPENDYTFQLPLFVDGNEILSITDNSIDFTQEFDYTTDQSVTKDINSGACPNPSDSYINIAATSFTGTGVTQDTKLFHVVSMGTITIDKGINIVDDTAKKLSLTIYDEAGGFAGATDFDRIDFTSADANSDLFITGDIEWTTGAFPANSGDLQMYVDSTSECDGTNEKTEYTVGITNWATYARTFVDTATLADDTFYRLTYKLNKCSVSSVEILDSTSTAIFDSASSGVEFDKIFKTGTLPGGGAVTIKFTIGDLLDYPNSDFNLDVLTDVTLYKLNSWDAWVVTEATETYVDDFTEIHSSVAQSVGSAYNPNIEYSYDLDQLPSGCYKVRTIKADDATVAKVSNCFTVCDANHELSQISWTPSKVICSGNDVIDYETYDRTIFFWARVDLQDMTIERDREYYRRSDGFWETPYTYQNTTEILQIHGIPEFVRKGLAIGLAGTFEIDGIEYQMLNDDDIAPLFNYRHVSPIRIPVHRVGDFTVVR